MKEKIFSTLIVLLLLVGLFVSLKMVKEMNSLNNRVNRLNYEYQFVIDGDSIIIFDNNRVVGKVKMEGKLKHLLVEDNR